MQLNKPVFRFSTLWIWLFACAITPILGNIWFESWSSSFGKKYTYATLLNNLVFIGIFTIPLVVTFINYLALRRLSKSSFFFKWLGVVLVTLVLEVVDNEYLSRYFFISYFNFQAHLLSLNSVNWFNYVFTRHWLLIFLYSVLSALLTYSLISFLLARVSHIKWRHFIVSVFVAVFLSEFLSQVLDILGFNYLNGYTHRYDLTGKSLSGGIYLLCGQALSSMFWGYVSYATLNWLVERDLKTSVSISRKYINFSGLVILICMLTLELVTHPHLLKQVNVNAVRSLTSAPQKDVSTGQTILQFVHIAEVVPPQYPVIDFSPDSKSFVMLDNKRTLQRVEIATGKNLGFIGAPIGGNERQQRQWSSSGKYFAYRTSGEKVTVDKGYTKYRSKFQLYNASSYQLLNEYTHFSDDCFDSYNTSLAFEDDKALWVTCEQEYTPKKPESVMAIKFTMPSMQVAEIRRYGQFVQHYNISGIASNEGHVYAWQSNTLYDNKNILIHDLSTDNPPVELPNLTESDLAGSLTKQYETVENGIMSILFCGNDSNVSDPATREVGDKTVHGFCRALLFNIKNGNLISKKDDANRKRFTNADEVEDVGSQRLIQSVWQEASKVGKIIVSDTKTGQILQEIKTVAQQRLKLSPDKHWLVSYANYKNEMRIYRVN